MKRGGCALLLAAVLAATIAIVEPRARPAQAADDQILLIADSVVLGAEPNLHQVFAPRPLTVVGFPALFARDAPARIAAHSHAVGRTAIVAVGYNYPFWDPKRFDDAVDAVVATLRGAGAERIVWVMLREVSHENSPRSSWWQADLYGWYFPQVNAALRAALLRHDSLSLVDWPSHSRLLGGTYDSIHLAPDGAATMAAIIRRAVDEAESGHAAREAWMRRVAALPAAGQSLPPGDPCAVYGTWNEANEAFWSALGGGAAHLDPDFDFLPCEARGDRPDAARAPSPESTVRYPEATLHAQAAPSRRDGYWMADLGGNVYGFGDARARGDHPGAIVVAIGAAGVGGYWLLEPSGRVHARGAPYHGDAFDALGATGEVATAIAGHDIDRDGDSDGYWIFTDRGRVLPFGSAPHFGDMSEVALNGPIVAAAPTPDGRGYWMVGSDGGVFTFGNAVFHGSTGDLALNSPVVGIVPDPDGSGYWLVASDGGIFAFDAHFRGSTGDLSLNRPVVGAVAHGSGYLLVASDGGIFNFSELPFRGSLGDRPPRAPVVSVATLR